MKRGRSDRVGLHVPPFEAFLLLGGPVLFLVLFFVVPFLTMASDSIWTDKGELTGEFYAKAVTDVFYWRVLLATFEMGLWTPVCTAVIGYPLAYYITFYLRDPLLRRLIYIVLVTPLFTSNVVRAFAWMLVLGRQGVVNKSLMLTGIADSPLLLMNTRFAMVVGLIYILLPIFVLTVASILQGINRSLLEAARDLGASAATTFWKVTFPLSLPGVLAGSILVFTLSVSAYVTPAVMSGGRHLVMPMVIFQQYLVSFNYHVGAVLSIMLLVMTLLLLGINFYFLGRRGKVA
ncbi:MAG: ABC transporter permease [Alphaproteobacteria bacterium]|nr:ABC transporter permease [Alphaproteobacteria bacterium]